MLTRLKIANFRSIQDAEIEVAPITLVYGPNGAGKSSLLYALLVLKHVSLNPNQALDAFFNLAFVNLGGFRQVVFDHRKEDTISLGLVWEENGIPLTYLIKLGERESGFALSLSGGGQGKLSLPVTFPYPSNQQTTGLLQANERSYTVGWNGLLVTAITVEAQPPLETQEINEELQKMHMTLNQPREASLKVDFVPLRRGFSKAVYSPVPASPFMMGEDEVATLLAQDSYLSGKVSTCLEQTTDRQFRPFVPLGTASWVPQTLEKSLGLTVELINDGFGINQLVYLLAKALRAEAHTVCIEEPEIHLPPRVLRKLAHVLVNIAHEEKKAFLITTHSESFVLALLAQIAEGNLKPTQLACYLATKEGKSTRFQRQKVTEDGQVEGGLATFMEGELEDLRAFLGLKK